MEHIVVVRPEEEIETRQGLPAFVGVCGGNCEATGLSMNLVVVPPGAVSEPHYHDGFETAIYQLSGRVETRYGPGLAESVVTAAGDFLFIPPGVPHQVRNLSEAESATAVIARNDPNEQESVVLYESSGVSENASRPVGGADGSSAKPPSLDGGVASDA